MYVRPFPDTGGKALISTDGGTEPVWSRNGRELFYRHGDQTMAADVATQPTFSAGTARVLFEGRYLPAYDVSHDGRQFVMIQPDPTLTDEIHFVLNWFEELKRLVPTN